MQATLAKGWPQSVKKPRAQLRSWHAPQWVASFKDVILIVAGLVISQRQFRLAWRESREGRLRQAKAKMLRPFEPKKAQKDVAHRQVIEVIRERLRGWSEHATIIAGRYGSGKSVALEEALRGAKGVLIHRVRGKEWEDALYKDLELDNFDMLRLLLARVGDELQKTEQNITSVPVIVLDIPRPTKEGTAWLCASLVWSLVVCACDREEWTPSRASPKSCRVTAAAPMPGPERRPSWDPTV
jgi:hypothetical protein